MKKKVIAILLLLTFALIGAGTASAQLFQKQKYVDALYICFQCGNEKYVTKIKVDKNTRLPADHKPPSNTGLCKKNPSKLSTAHDYRFYSYSHEY